MCAFTKVLLAWQILVHNCKVTAHHHNLMLKLVTLQSIHSKRVEKQQGLEGVAKIYALETQNSINCVSSYVES